MSDPVFVIHGVGNRDREDFANRVAALQAATGDRWDMKPVYWGDLAADDRWVALTIPSQDELSAVDRAQDWGRDSGRGRPGAGAARSVRPARRSAAPGATPGRTRRAGGPRRRRRRGAAARRPGGSAGRRCGAA